MSTRWTNSSHWREPLRLRGQQHGSRRSGMDNDEHPLAQWHMRDDLIHQVLDGLRHGSGNARWARAGPLATEGDQLVVAAVTGAKPKEAMRQDAEFEEDIELVFDELGQVGCGGGFGFGLGEEDRGVLMHQAVQRRRSGRWRSYRTGAPSSVRCGLPIDGLQALLLWL